MTTNAFWDLIAAANAASGGTWDGRMETLAELLSKLPPAEIVEFDRIFHEQRLRAYSYDLWGAAFIFGDGGCSDDSFTDFRTWLISMGKDAFEQALRDPDSLADIQFGEGPGEEEDAFFEEYAYTAMVVHKGLTGEEMPDHAISHPEKPAGTVWSEDNLPARYPRLWAALND